MKKKKVVVWTCVIPALNSFTERKDAFKKKKPEFLLFSSEVKMESPVVVVMVADSKMIKVIDKLLGQQS